MADGSTAGRPERPDGKARGAPPRRGRGFTILELMVVIVVLGVLAAVAVPSFIRYVRRAKTAEASDKLANLYQSSLSYVSDANRRVTRGATGADVNARFPVSAPKNPAARCCEQPGKACYTADADWDTPTWNALNFGITDPFYFQYTYDSSGTDTMAVFSARAEGDFDCDGIFSTFERSGFLLDPTNDIVGSRGLYRKLPNE